MHDACVSKYAAVDADFRAGCYTRFRDYGWMSLVVLFYLDFNREIMRFSYFIEHLFLIGSGTMS